ncbi:MAG: methyltransferase domain-containing protein [Verrucomicrobiales bacterium]|nr:methyltransferase domain-containing protein [Verrucomicrobiales bacterium]
MKTSAPVKHQRVPNSKIRKRKPTVNKSKKPTEKINVLGPVDDLQSYVKADWWKDVFNANYLRTDGDVVEDPEITDREVSTFIEILQPGNTDGILDLCCGQGRHSIALARRGFTNVSGLDRSHYLISRARTVSKREGLSITFREGDARKLPFRDDSFDHVIVPGNSFGYFDSTQEDASVLNEIHRVLKPGGNLLLDLTDGEYMAANYEPRSWEWIDKNYLVCRERCMSDDGSRLISREVITHTQKGVVSDQFYAERLYSQPQMIQMLEALGFSGVKAFEPFVTGSQRNQDLGMMAQRVLYRAETRKEWAPVRHSVKIRNVSVLLGDPRRSDVVKPNGSFAKEDFVVLDKLKEALGSLDGYEFSFLDNHETLVADLQQIKPNCDFVFNLCDEGFDNRARYELHIPALLETFGIPYTGGTPQCLAFCYDKSLVRGIAKELEIPVPDAFMIEADNPVFHEITIPFPVIVKPNFGDSSFGITQNCVCRDIVELEAAICEIKERFGYSQTILVEQFLTGKDISAGFIGNMPNDLNPLPVIEEDYSGLPVDYPKICGYEAKWDPASPYWNLKSVPAGLPEDVESFLIASCRRLFERLECQDYARFDWRLDNNGTPRLLEANPNPGWCWDGHLAKMARLDRSDYSGMLKRILDAGYDRIFPGNRS